MENSRLTGWDIHGFQTMEDLDIRTIMEEARTRWLRTNEIYAMLCNHNCFSINAKPVNLPKSGTIVLFDRKVLRNFRKDGHNWKKKNDGKTVKEAHEHLKVGNEERIHVYYAHGQDNPTFVRRCYWLLDKSREHIVLVHYRETQEILIQLQNSSVTPNLLLDYSMTPVSSNSSSSISDQSAPRLEDSMATPASCADHGESTTPGHIERKIHEINTLDWDELVDINGHKNSAAPRQSDTVGLQLQNQHILNSSNSGGSLLQSNGLAADASSYWTPSKSITTNHSVSFDLYQVACDGTLGGHVNSDFDKKECMVDIDNSMDIFAKDGLQSQDSFGRWMDSVAIDSMGLLDDPILESSISSYYGALASPMIDHQQSSITESLFCITDVSPAWGFSSEKTKILVTGYFHEEHAHLANSNLFCICGNTCFPAEIVQVGVYRFFVSHHPPGLVNLFLSLDGRKPISQVMGFEYRTPLLQYAVDSAADDSNWKDFKCQMRLATLLFSKSKTLSSLGYKVSPTALKKANNYAMRTSQAANVWDHLINAVQENKVSLHQAKDSLFEHALRNRLQEWLLERIIDGRKYTDYDEQGQGVIHHCAILGYAWAVPLYSFSGLSLDYRDKFGWTALHWAAYYGREKMVAVLLSAGARPNLVTDPNSENDGGCTAADLASKNGYEGLAAYLAEKALVEHFREMIVAGNVSGSLQINTTDPVKAENLSEEELNLKETLAAYRTAADAAARIQTAFREQTFKLQAKAIKLSNAENEARSIIAAMKIQHAYRKYETKKQMHAAVKIQYRFRTWKIRKDFLYMRHQAIKIQAVFRGYKQRKEYHKIIWSVGVLEKVILRWLLKRKGLRELEVDPSETMDSQNHEESNAEEDFFRASRKQAEERVERSVVKVQAMFRSKKAQEDYRRMKLAHSEAKLEYDELLDPDIYIENRGEEIHYA